MGKKLNILALSSWYPNDTDPQQGIFVQHQLEAIQKEHNITLLLARPGNKTEVTSSQKGNLTTTIIHYNAPLKFLKPIMWLLAWRSALNLIRKENFDLIHLHVIFPMGIIGIWLKKKLKIPLIITEHWSGYRRPEEYSGRFRKWITKKATSSAKAIIVQSNFLKKLMTQIGVANTFYRVPNIVRFTHIKKGSSATTQGIRILNVADHVDSDKNITGLLHAIKMCLNVDSTLNFFQIGSGPDTNKLKKLSTKLNLGSRFKWMGRLENKDVLEEINNCDFGVINSNVETFSVVAFEFLAAGKPIIITKCGGPEEYLPNHFGLLVEPNNNEELSKAIVTLSKTFTSLPLESVSQEIRHEFSEEKFLERINRVYLQVTND